jgi:hypothetical protein
MLKSSIFCDTSRSLLKLPLSSLSNNSQARNQREEGSKQSLLHTGFLLGLFFDPEYGGNMIF